MQDVPGTGAPGEAPADGTGPNPAGKHRTPGARPPWMATARVTVVVAAVGAALCGVLSLANQLTTGETAHPASAPAGGSGTASAPAASPGAGTGSAPGTASPGRWTTAGSAASMVTAFETQLASAVDGALIFAGTSGENTDNTPVVVQGEWSSARLSNGLTERENNTQSLRAGNLTPPVRLPTATTTARIVVSNTDVRRLPVQSAKDAFAGLAQADGPACAECEPIVITGVTSTTMRVNTTVGRLTVPAWSYAVEDSEARIVVPALTPSALINPGPGYRGETAAEFVRSQLPLWRFSMGGDGRVLTAYLDTGEIRARGGCWRLYAVERDSAVAVFATSGRGIPAAPCASSSGRVTLQLAKPLGDRTLLDTYWSRALAP